MLKERVSVAVITYNSAETVLETLDSIATQTYGTENIELIISDDASTDTTVSTIDIWLAEHQKKFASVLFIKNAVNGGISKNYNIALKAATCDWIKPIAGDDILLKTCLDLNFNFVKNTPDAQIVLSSANLFFNSKDKEGFKKAPPDGPFLIEPYALSTKKQFEWLIHKGNFCLAPTLFVKTAALKRIGYADERFPQIEDYPMYIKWTKLGIRLNFFDTITVNYRIRKEKKETNFLNVVRYQNMHLIYKILVTPERGNLFKYQINLSYSLIHFIFSIYKKKQTLSKFFFLRIASMIHPISRSIFIYKKRSELRLFLKKFY
jgi:glycosyltransferase involved in cell wall biosynthesis